ncbi:teichoic acid transport system permease protein [Paenibacillus jamilae]|nr:teichoic acid transport system permease protein [Paenibacillus jamilae]
MKVKWGLVFVISMLVFSVLLNLFIQTPTTMYLKMSVKSKIEDDFQVYLMDTKKGSVLSEDNSVSLLYSTPGVSQELKFRLNTDINKIRLDLGSKPSLLTVSDFKIASLLKNYEFSINNISTKKSNQISRYDILDSAVRIETAGNDPYVYVSLPPNNKERILEDNTLVKHFICLGISLVLSILLCLLLKIRKEVFGLLKELYQNKELIYRLSLNDFKTRYAGSYLGIIWAFVQPIITVLIYWFVFEVGFRSGPVQNVPYILWLIAGIVPWFFFAESLGNSTNALLEYNYLVKKVVFQIRVLPFMKILSSAYVHLFFILIIVLIYGVYGLFPDVYYLQLLYYSLAAFALVYSMSLITSSLILFFKDLGQIISLVLQFGMWLTPILWNENMLPTQFRWILKINPAYYIAEGYRDSLIYKVWFWDRYNQSVYYWALTCLLFIVGVFIMKKLKPHFADVL